MDVQLSTTPTLDNTLAKRNNKSQTQPCLWPTLLSEWLLLVNLQEENKGIYIYKDTNRSAGQLAYNAVWVQFANSSTKVRENIVK